MMVCAMTDLLQHFGNIRVLGDGEDVFSGGRERIWEERSNVGKPKWRLGDTKVKTEDSDKE